ncbi:MAG: immunoglobulin-like domain-containing protein [Oscillospiraceae bacterium]
MKKRLLALLLVLTLLVGLMPAALAADTVDVAALPEYAADADISTGTAYKISTEESLRAFAAAVKADDGNGTYNLSGVSFYLAGDIALTGTWTPVGSTTVYFGDFFAGTFDGCGHTISGLNVQGSTANQGLFAAINKATIRNLNVSGTVSCGTKNYVGGIVGKVQAGTIENCSFSGSVTGGYTGGIAGGLNSDNVTISGCANLAAVTGTTAGGILGYSGSNKVTKVTIENCYNAGSITGSGKAGGIVGQLSQGTIENCYSIGAIDGAAKKGGIFAFSSATVKNCYYTLPEAETLGGTAAAAAHITSPEGLADKLGNAFKEDTAGANGGYPILVWQAGEVVQPDPRIELTGPDTLWRTANEPQPQATIAAACKDMDKDTHVDWTLTEGEGIVTLETPEGAGAANRSVIVKATADGAGRAVITASTANGITASITIYVIPQITTVELEGVVAVGETVRAKVNVLGGSEYDYANFPALQIQWRYATQEGHYEGTYQDIAGATGYEYTIPEDMAGNYLSFMLYDTVSREYKMLSSPVRIATAEERLLKADASALTLDTSDIRAATTLTLPAAGAVNGSAITWASSDSSIIDPATGVVTMPASGIQTVTLSATLTRGEATAYRSFDIRVWSQAELDKEAAKSELQKLVERLDGTITLTPEYGQDTNVNTMLSAKLDDSSIAVSVSKVEEVYGGAGIAADGTITYFYADPNTTPLVHNGSYNVTFALSKAGATETLQVPVVIGWDVQRVRDAISAEITSRLTTEGLCAAGDDPNLLTQDLTLPKVIDGKRWALISWTSSDPTAIAVSDKNQQTADTLFDPYVGVVKTPTQDTTVTLTATVTFQLTDAQEQTVTVSKVFTVTVKGQQTNVREQLLAKLDAGFASYGGLRDAVTGLPLTQRDGKYLVANDIHFPTTRDFGVDGKYTPVTITSSDTDTIVPPDVNNAARAEVYRPLPGEAAKDVTVTVTITDSDSGVSASRDFVIEVQPLTQQEIDAELALMAAVKAHYFDGIRNANTDAKNILTDLHPFQEAYLDADGRLVWVYDHADLTGSGIVPVAMDGWTESEQWRLFRSSDPDVISHENLLVTRAAGDKTVTVSSELSSETLGKCRNAIRTTRTFRR